MKKLLQKHVTQFLPQPHHMPKYSIARVMFGVIGGVGLLSLVGGFFGYTVEASSGGQEVIIITPTPKKIGKKAIKAYAGEDQTITLPATSITLYGTGSTGSVAKYMWKQTKGPKKLTISNATSSVATLTNLVKGTYTFELKVRDSRSLSSRDTVVITIKGENKTTDAKTTDNKEKAKSNEPKPVFNYPGNTPINIANNKAPVANAGPDQTISLPTNTTKLHAFQSSDTDGFIALINWKQISGPTTVTLSAIETNMEVSTSALSAGKYVFEVSITDDKGSVSSDKVTVIVK